MPRSSRSSTSTFSGRPSSAPRCCSPSAAGRRPLLERPRRWRWRVRRGSERPPGPAARDRSSRRSARRELRADPRVHPGRMGGLPGLDLRELRHDVADLVRVHVLRAQQDDPAGELAERLAHVQFPPPTVAGAVMPGSVRGSVTTPLIALAAAVIGEARNVRPPFPWRPSKLRLLVLIAYWPGRSWSPFIAMHMEQPASRHSAPAARNTSWRPSL